MSAKQEAQEWAETVRRYGERNDAHLRAGRRDQPEGRRRWRSAWAGPTGSPASWPRASGASSCDADEKEVGGLFGKAVLPTAMLAKAHMPDLAKVVPAFNVESIEGHEVVTQRFARKVEFESIDFNRRFLATVPQASTTRSRCASCSAPASSPGRRR